ncbi:hypothetical protein Tco_0948353 [Tanacetum coccineum]
MNQRRMNQTKNSGNRKKADGKERVESQDQKREGITLGKGAMHKPQQMVVSLGAAVELSPTSYLNVRAVRHNLLRGGNSALEVSSLRSTGGMNSEASNGGSGDNGNSNDVGTGGGKCSDDGGGGSGGEGI